MAVEGKGAPLGLARGSQGKGGGLVAVEGEICGRLLARGSQGKGAPLGQ